MKNLPILLHSQNHKVSADEYGDWPEQWTTSIEAGTMKRKEISWNVCIQSHQEIQHKFILSKYKQNSLLGW